MAGFYVKDNARLKMVNTVLFAKNFLSIFNFKPFFSFPYVKLGIVSKFRFYY